MYLGVGLIRHFGRDRGSLLTAWVDNLDQFRTPRPMPASAHIPVYTGISVKAYPVMHLLIINYYCRCLRGIHLALLGNKSYYCSK